MFVHYFGYLSDKDELIYHYNRFKRLYPYHLVKIFVISFFALIRVELLRKVGSHYLLGSNFVRVRL